jgi:hypothetical protein
MQIAYPRVDSSAANGTDEQIKAEILDWLFHGRCGISSKTIAAAMVGMESQDACTPRDYSDFKRCAEMLKACPSIRNLSPVKVMLPFFAPLIDNWNEMIDILETEDPRECPAKLSRYIRARNVESNFIQGTILDQCKYVSVEQFEKTYGMEVTLDNIHQCLELAEEQRKANRLTPRS